MIAVEFYGHLFQGHKDGSHPDTTQAARALHLAVTRLRADLGGNLSYDGCRSFITGYS